MLRLVRSANLPEPMQQGAARPRPRRVQARLLLAGVRPHRRDRRLGGPPHAGRLPQRPRQGRRAHRRRLQGPAVHLGRRRRHHPAPPQAVASELTRCASPSLPTSGSGSPTPSSKELQQRGHEVARPRCAQRRRARRLGVGVGGGGARRRRRARRAGRRVLLDRDGRVDRRQQGRGRSAPRCASTRRPRPARASGTTPTCSRSACAPRRRPSSARSSTRGSPARRATSPTTWPTSSTWPTSGDRAQRAGRRAARAGRGRALGARARRAAARARRLRGHPAAGDALAPGRARVGAARAAREGARRRRLLLNPANLAPLAFPRNAVVIHDAAALRHPGWYSPALRALAARGAARHSEAGARRHHRQRVLQARAGRAAGRRRAASSPAASTRDSTRRRPRAGQSRPRPDPALRPHGGEPDRPQEPRRPWMPRPAAGATTASISSPPAAIGRSSATSAATSGGPRALGHVPDAHLPGPLRGRARLRAALLARGLRPDVHRGDGLRRARRGGPRRRAARDLRRRRALRRPLRPRRHRRPGRRQPSTTTRCAPPGRATRRRFTWERTARELDALLSAA